MTALSYAQGSAEEALPGLTIGGALAATARRVPEADALISAKQGYRATYGELHDLTGEVARGLMSMGVEKGDRIGLWAPNRYEWVVVQLAAARVGAILVTLNPAYKRMELEYSLQKAGVSLLIMSRAFRRTDLVEILHDVRPHCPELRDVIVLEDDWSRVLTAATLRSEAELSQRESQVQFDDPAYIMYTSGTTGKPKGSILTHQGQINCGTWIGRTLNLSENDRICLPVPLFHAFGCMIGVLACVSRGSAIVLSGEAFEPSEVLGHVADEQCTALYGVPAMFIQELALDGYDVSSLRIGVMGGAPCPIEVMRDVQQKMNMREVVVVYGMTETAITTMTRPDDPIERQIGTVGRALPFTEIKLIGPDGRIVPRGEPGEVCARGYSNMLGYWGDEEATRNALDNTGWMHTGDLATMDDEGYLKIVGRIKDMIVRGGENIFPAEIEQLLYTHPAIDEVQVVGVPSRKYGEEVAAFVRTRGSATLSVSELGSFCKGQIATYKIPAYWMFVDQFPMTASGKVLKYKLREQAISELDLHDVARIETA